MVPITNAPRIPMYFTIPLVNQHDIIIRQNVNEFPALIRYGFWAPPAPNEFIAPQRPGARRLVMPKMVAL